jgi:RimJ/RimL family protein N-acetyltransferase
MESRIYLRAFISNDYFKSYKWRNDFDISNGLICRKLFISIENEKEWIEKTNRDKINNVKVAICLISDDEYIGNIYLTEIDHVNKNAGIGIFIGDKKHQNKGYATEAINLILDHAFNDLGLERVESKIFTSNKLSIKAHEKNGFIKEGVLRNYFFKNGKYNDVTIMSILKKEYISYGN